MCPILPRKFFKIFCEQLPRGRSFHQMRPIYVILLVCIAAPLWEAFSSLFDEAVDLFERGNARFTLNAHAEAIVLYRRAIALAPDVYAYHTNLGHALLAIDASADAVGAYTIAANLHPTAAKTHYNLGRGLQVPRCVHISPVFFS